MQNAEAANSDRQRSQRHWNLRTADNVIRSKMAPLRSLLADIARRRSPQQHLLVHGPNGIGISRAIKNACNAAQRPVVVISGAQTPTVLAARLQEAARRNAVAYIRSDAVWCDATRLQILIAATNTGAPKVYEPTNPRIKRSFCFNGLTVIIESKFNFKRTRRYKRRTRDAMDTLLTQIEAFVINADADDVYEYTIWQIICENAFGDGSYTIEETNDCLDYFARNRHRLMDVSLAAFKGALVRRRANPTDWRDILEGGIDGGQPARLTEEQIPRVYAPPPRMIERSPEPPVIEPRPAPPCCKLKLVDADIIAIKESKESNVALAARYGTKERTIRRYRRNERRGAVRAEHPAAIVDYRLRLTNAQVNEIRASTEPVKALAARYGVTQRHIRRIQGGERRRNVA